MLRDRTAASRSSANCVGATSTTSSSPHGPRPRRTTGPGRPLERRLRGLRRGGGRTGFPLVDAAMAQLRQEGFMHNRARMVVASFLTKDLYLDWRPERPTSSTARRR